MRLIDTEEMVLKDFPDDRELPAYAILSHTWGAEEVTFQEFGKQYIESKEGYRKIEACCSQARGQGLRYAWVDTCTIDKASSAELSEAINSMFRWYKNAAVCYVYLRDVEVENIHHAKDFEHARWFTRGWTLQELIAPQRVTFFNAKWQSIGDKKALEKHLSQITRIPLHVLHGAKLSSISVASKMSWAAKRQTTRVEDLAYCLLGIFDVHMPLLYGEGQNAFLRLQEEIMKTTADQSIFAWRKDFPIEIISSNNLSASLQSKDSSPYVDGVLAIEPSVFENSSDIDFFTTERDPPLMTSKGIRINMPIITGSDGTLIGLLDCHVESDYVNQLGIKLMATSGKDSMECGRVPQMPVLGVRQELAAAAEVKSLYLHKQKTWRRTDSISLCVLRTVPARFGFKLTDSIVVGPQSRYKWNIFSQAMTLELPGSRHLSALLFETRNQRCKPRNFVVMILVDEGNGSQHRRLSCRAFTSFPEGYFVGDVPTQLEEFAKSSEEVSHAYISSGDSLLNITAELTEISVFGRKVCYVDINAEKRYDRLGKVSSKLQEIGLLAR
jgi:hypothetical protein